MPDQYELYPGLDELPLPKNGRSGSFDRDQADLLRLGKKPVLKVRRSYTSSCLGTEAHLQRNFGFMSMLGFSCTVLVTWEAVLM